MVRSIVPLLLPLLAGCIPEDGITSGSEVLWQHFPFDGLRTWEYVSTDLEVTYKLVGTMREDDPNPEVSEDYNVYHVDFTTKCVAADPSCVDGGLVRTIAFSSDVSNGSLIHKFVQGSLDVDYDPPLVIAPDDVNVGESYETITDGQKWSSTLVAFEPCDGIVKMQGDQYAASNCSAHLQLTDGDANSDTNQGLAGDYWVAKGLGIIGIKLEGDDGTWGLSKLECEPAEDCNGQW